MIPFRLFESEPQRCVRCNEPVPWDEHVIVEIQDGLKGRWIEQIAHADRDACRAALA